MRNTYQSQLAIEFTPLHLQDDLEELIERIPSPAASDKENAETDMTENAVIDSTSLDLEGVFGGTTSWAVDAEGGETPADSEQHKPDDATHYPVTTRGRVPVNFVVDLNQMF